MSRTVELLLPLPLPLLLLLMLLLLLATASHFWPLASQSRPQSHIQLVPGRAARCDRAGHNRSLPRRI
eukprot:SAG31_NODE_3898_length_3772_cov_2.045467_1_plen_68_part_00